MILCLAVNPYISQLMAEANNHHKDISASIVYVSEISGFEAKDLHVLQNPENFYAGERLTISNAVNLPPVKNVDFKANAIDSSGEYNGECVTYVKNARKDLFVTWGGNYNGEKRKDNLIEKGFEVNKVPRVGAAFIVVAPGKSINAHTGLVSEIKLNKNGEYVIHVIEANLNGDGKITERDVKSDGFENWYFVHEQKNIYDRIIAEYELEQSRERIKNVVLFNPNKKKASETKTSINVFAAIGNYYNKTKSFISESFSKDLIKYGEFTRPFYLDHWSNENAESGYSSFGEITSSSSSKDKRFGFIHTGLGSEKNMGYISQDIIPYKASSAVFNVRYNFVTTEYPQWLGSQYNDSFVIKIEDISTGQTKEIARFNGSLNQLFDENDPIVQNLPSEFLDSASSGGGQTGWITKSSDKLYLKSGGMYRIYAEVRDVGDRIVDSALLIDKVSLQ